MPVFIQSTSGEEQSKDLFSEVLVKQRWGRNEFFALALIVLGYVLLILLALRFLVYVAAFLPFVLAVSIYLTVMAIRSLNKEYEYIVTNGHLDVDCIKGKHKRRRVFSLSPADLEEARPFEAGEAPPREARCLDCSSRQAGTALWCVRGKYRDKQIFALIDGNRKTLDNLRRHNPRKVRPFG